MVTVLWGSKQIHTEMNQLVFAYGSQKWDNKWVPSQGTHRSPPLVALHHPSEEIWQHPTAAFCQLATQMSLIHPFPGGNKRKPRLVLQLKRVAIGYRWIQFHKIKLHSYDTY